VNLIGQSPSRPEDRRLLAGAGQFVADAQIAGVCHAVFLRSPHAHARLAGIDTTAARALPGVLGVLTGTDVEGKIRPIRPNWTIGDLLVPVRHVLAVDVVRMVGEPVAMVIAKDLATAHAAAELIKVEYVALPAVVDEQEAAKEGAPQLHSEIPGNLLTVYKVRGGSWKAAVSAADVLVKLRLVNNRLLPSPLETRGVVAHYDAHDETMSVVMGSQMPQMHRRWIAWHLGFPEHRLRVSARDVGGGFGCKMHLYPEDMLVPYAARRFGVPVRWIEGRSESHGATTHGRAHTEFVEVAARSDGRVLGLRLKSYANVGAYLSNMAAGIPTINCANQVTGNYDIAHFEADVHLMVTNTQPVDAYRGAGRPEATYIVERAMDAVASELQLDPIEVRRRNFIRPEQFPYAPYGHESLRWDSGNYEACLNRAVALLDVPAWRAEQLALRGDGRLIGIGLTAYTEMCGVAPSIMFGMTGFERGGWESARLSVHADGTATLVSGSMSTGQGHAVTLAQIVATELQLPLASIRVVQGDSDTLQAATGTYNSRSISVGGTAALLCARKVMERARAYAAAWLGTGGGELDYQEGVFRVGSADGCVESVRLDNLVGFDEVARNAHNAHVRPQNETPVLEETVFYDPKGFNNPNGVHAAVVEVDPDTGCIEILDYVAVDDIGTVINPLLAEGQLLGGIVQGLGQALTEEVRYGADGALLTRSLVEYGLPRASLLPRIRVEFLCTPTPSNPLGAKGVGEAGAVAAPPVMVSAVCDALAHLGVKHLDMPMTPPRVWAAIRAANGGGQTA
jgi:aerobic carbon-monoxide dehydrogenase large subunit